MGLVFDSKSANLYASWYRTPRGKAIERLVEAAFPLLLDPQPRERIVDIGCGEGNHLLFFSRLGLDLTGIDASPYMIARARERLGSRSCLKVGRAEDLPFEDNEFDLSALINTLEFVESPLEALKEAARVTKRAVFIGVFNSLSWCSLSNKVVGLFRKSPFRDAQFFNLWELKALIKAALGDVPMAWCCTPLGNPLFKPYNHVSAKRYVGHCPFGSFLALSATMLYRVRTEQHPLKVGLEKAKRSVLDGITMDKLRSAEVYRRDERSLSLRENGEPKSQMFSL